MVCRSQCGLVGLMLFVYGDESMDETKQPSQAARDSRFCDRHLRPIRERYQEFG